MYNEKPEFEYSGFFFSGGTNGTSDMAMVNLTELSGASR